MVQSCSVLGCYNRKDREKHLQYYRLPCVVTNQGEEWKKLTEDRRRLWIANINQCFEGKNIDNIRVCSAHFIGGKKAEMHDQTNPSWCPTENLAGRNEVTDILSPSGSRFCRLTNRKKRKLDMTPVIADVEMENMEPRSREIETQTDMSGMQIELMQREIAKLQADNEMKKGLENHFSQEDLSQSDEKVRNFTGLTSFALLLTLYNYLEPYLSPHKSLSKFRMLVMTLMRLRFNLPVLILANEFHTSQSSITRMFASVVDTMYARLKPFIYWPDREALIKTMPMQFRKHFGKRCAVIIDCFEIFLERPSNLKARAETWSSYKHHNTMKFLIGITPQGTISYISRGWGGRVSDKYITEHSGFLNHIIPGDLILADRGFDISDTIGTMSAQLYIPAFTRGKNQLSAVDVETTRKIANVRIHVERVIGTVRQKYQLLGGTIPIVMVKSKNNGSLTMIDKIVHICCSLVNLNDSVVDFD